MKSETEVGTTAMAAAVLKAVLGNNKKEDKHQIEPEPDMNKLDVDALVDTKVIDGEKDRAKKRLEFSIGATATIPQLLEARAHYVSFEGWENDVELRPKVNAIDARIAEIKKIGGDHLGYSELTAAIQTANTADETRAVLARLESETFTPRGDTRYSAPDREWVQQWKSAHKGVMPEGSVFFEERWHIPFQPDSGHEKTGGMKRVESLVKQMVFRVQKARKVAGRQKATEIRARTDLLDFPIEKVRAKEMFVPGSYRIEIPAYKRGDSMIRPEGLVVLEAETRKGKEQKDEYTVLKFRDGTGCADRLVGKTYRGSDRNGRSVSIGLSLTIGQIFAKDLKIPQVYVSSAEGQRDLAYFAKIMREGIVALFRMAEVRSNEVNREDDTGASVA